MQKIALKRSIIESDDFYKEGSVHIIPKNAKFVKLADRKVEIGSISRLVKESWADAQIKNASVSHKVVKDRSNLFYLQGNEFSKYAAFAPTTSLDLVDTQWAALHCGATAYDLEKIAELSLGESYTLEGKIKSPKPLSDLKDRFEHKYACLSDGSLQSKYNSVKLAAALEDKTTVSAVLALGLARKRNVDQYLDLLPSFESALTELAKILISARLGSSKIDPDTAKEALEAMSALVSELKIIKSRGKKA